MKLVRIALLSMAVLGMVVAGAFAAGDAGKGKALFNDPRFAGGIKACSACHPNGKGLEKSGDKKEFKVMGKTQKSLEEAVNACIVNANMGKAIDVKSQQMHDMVAYIRSLKGPAKKSGDY